MADAMTPDQSRQSTAISVLRDLVTRFLDDRSDSTRLREVIMAEYPDGFDPEAFAGTNADLEPADVIKALEGIAAIESQLTTTDGHPTEALRALIAVGRIPTRR
jgi:hypothetical protein